MTTASTNTTIANTSNATFQAWVSEVLTNLVTNCGMTQTADTGQINPATVALPGAGATSAGYAILAFNDTLQSTAPIYLKLEFGTGATTVAPGLWITIGTGSNGSGTLTGTVGTRVYTGANGAPQSTGTNYTSRYCYNASLGIAWMVLKIGSQSVGSPNSSSGGFVVFRSVNSSGAPTASSATLWSQSVGTTISPDPPYSQAILYGPATVAGPTTNLTNSVAYVPFSVTSTLVGTNGQVFPCFQNAGISTAPGLGVTSQAAFCLLSEVAVNATVSMTILGSTPVTYISVGSAFSMSGVALTALSYSPVTYGFLLPWQ
jgi:hypothetical protein